MVFINNAMQALLPNLPVERILFTFGHSVCIAGNFHLICILEVIRWFMKFVFMITSFLGRLSVVEGRDDEQFQARSVQLCKICPFPPSLFAVTMSIWGRVGVSLSCIETSLYQNADTNGLLVLSLVLALRILTLQSFCLPEIGVGIIIKHKNILVL